MGYSTQNGYLLCDGSRIKAILDSGQDTPFYLYSAEQIRSNYQDYVAALEGLDAVISYAVKANGNLSILRTLREMGGWATLVSGNEIRLAIEAGYNFNQMIFNGNGKTLPELQFAIDNGVLINIDSYFDLLHISELAVNAGKTVNVLLRINPEIDARVHPYISTGLRTSKFGIRRKNIPAIVDELRKRPALELVGIHCHLGSTIKDVSVYRQTMEVMVDQYVELNQIGFSLKYINLGGGLGIDYEHQSSEFPKPDDMVEEIKTVLPEEATLIIEPGRSLVGNAGVLLCRVIGIKDTGEKKFIVTDASMSELIRPSLYGAYHDIGFIEPVNGEIEIFDIVGPVCESTDTLGKERKLVEPKEGAGVVIYDCGAYGYVMSSNYNARQRPAELIIDGGRLNQIRRAETFEDLLNTMK